MAKYLFDTSALIAHYRKERGADRVHAILTDDSADVVLSSVTVAEFARCVLGLG